MRDRVRDLQARIDITGDSGGSGSLSWVGWMLAGVGGATAIAGVITGVVALDYGDQLATRCPGFVCSDPADRGLIDDADSFAIATDVLLISGLTLAAGGVVLALVLDMSADSPTPTAGCSSDGCMIGVTQDF